MGPGQDDGKGATEFEYSRLLLNAASAHPSLTSIGLLTLCGWPSLADSVTTTSLADTVFAELSKDTLTCQGLLLYIVRKSSNSLYTP